MNDYIALAVLTIFFVFLCIYCRKKSALFILGIIWFIVTILRKIIWIVNVEFIIDSSTNISSPVYQSQMIYTAHITDFLRNIGFIALGLSVIIFFIQCMKNKKHP